MKNTMKAYPWVLLTLTILIGSLNLTSSSFAQGIRIIDCQGKTKAMRQSSVSNSVELSVVTAAGQLADNVDLTLKNGNGDLLKATTKNGIAEFPEVGQGVWMLSAQNPGLFFTSISLSDGFIPPFWDRAGDFLLEAGKVALVGAAVVGAAVLVDEASNGNGSGEDNTVSPPPAMDCPACNPDQAAPSIPPFQ